MRIQLFILVLLAAVPLTPQPAAAQQAASHGYSRGAGTWPNFNIYRSREVPPPDLSDSPRLDRLIREGKLYLSLSDAIALALENNLDIAQARYGPSRQTQTSARA